ncbi:MAG: sulfur-oxidizing protein SoxZ [Cycloclasticus pugetii]|jgi:sulfur-oxidizing protein SoxZ|uniref:Phosphodiesterase I n=1 Tax=Cycloclasticus pugetii TaxID=34068 RepID=A0AB33Z3I4_9GAMM|nr:MULTISPECIES: thiosulfate oxidation carrier complex protein SoxZ [Cycloclasticus]ATI03003.1 thiosulfate oxidation carrier complex protein SoxZ [Cycloclasticus sp. PY97N]EPD13756.1 phosphodiesterase I [Cycloclasticus pugetii]MDF1829384.1 thiosulfate oxidation carrier complex protein SoxZ [Cycloclasticus pugetii]PHR48453.1 MAG: thiosulfate oxidation carrier complex protein SoxZ [Cycloclasticus sp.]SHI41061.1 sulfur compound chelating protein SoxZ [Cycloclasticus pugetii]
MKVRAKIINNITHVRVLAIHPMETGERIDKDSGERISAKYIQKLSCEHNGKEVFLAQFGTSISQNPYLAFSFKEGKKGDILSLRWNDNTGDVKKTDTTIK